MHTFLRLFLIGAVFFLPFCVFAQSDALTTKQFLAGIDQKMPDLLADFNVPGVALCIIENGKVVLQKGYGLADVSEGTLVSTTTGFNIGSISKTFTAWGVMKLVEEGKLKLDDPVEQYLSRWKLPASEFNAEGVTIRRLLSHTAGLSLHGYPGWSMEDPLPTIEESLDGKTNGPERVELIIEPGSQWKYSGGGFTLLQLLIEEVSGMSFADFMQAEVLAPLGMPGSSFRIDEEIVGQSSQAHDAFGGQIGLRVFTAQAAAGFHTNIEDFSTLVLANLHPKRKSLLPAAVIETMMNPAPNSNGIYGLGYQVDPLRGTSVVLRGHDGANEGWHALFRLNPETNDALIVLTNSSSGFHIYRQLYCDWVSWAYGADLGYGCDIRIPISNVLKPIVDAEGIESAAEKYGELLQAGSGKFDFAEQHLNTLGYTYLGAGDLDQAIAVFKLYTELHPYSSNAFDSQGEALLMQDRKEEAITSYRKSVDLHPGNAHAIQVLKGLGVSVEDLLPEVEIDVEVLESYTGQYELAPGFMVTVTLEGKQLVSQATGQGPLFIYPRSENVFYLTVTQAQVTFNADAKGVIESFTFLQRGRETVARKLKD